MTRMPVLTTTPSQPTTETTTKHSRKRKKPNVPQPGEPGYKTPTQLRNERKRRAKKQQVGVKSNDGRSTSGSGVTDTKPTSNSKKTAMLDPSSRYLDNPTAAPLVQKAIAFFKTTTPPQKGDFKIHPVGGSNGAMLTGWRTVAKLAVRAKDGKISIGLFAPNSHDLLPVPNCAAHHPSINAAVAILEQLLNRTPTRRTSTIIADGDDDDGNAVGATTAFDESTGKGHLRHVAINVERSTGKVQITLVWNSHPFGQGKEGHDNNDEEEKKILDSFTNAIVMAAGDGRKRRRGRKGTDVAGITPVQPESVPEKQPLNLHSLWVHFNASWKHSNAIFSIEGGPDSWKHVYGPRYIEESLSLTGQATPVALRFPPNVFRQANLDAFTNIVDVIRSTIKSKFSDGKPSCVELYGGVGTIGLNVADLTSPLISSDENPFNKECFLAAAAPPKHDSSSLMYETKNATAMVRSKALEKGQVIIVDPPRKGLDDEVLAALCSAETPELLVYVSCGFDAFQRDCGALLQSRWRLDHAEGHLLFPGSDAIETLAFFTRK